MKAITICQPYAHLFLLPPADPRLKRVENRSWSTRHRGPTYLHAGKSLEWLDVEDGVDRQYQIRVDDMAFGAIVAVANLADCIHVDRISDNRYSRKYPWLATHVHARGPWCWIFDRVHKMTPLPWKGAQGLFDIDHLEVRRLQGKGNG